MRSTTLGMLAITVALALVPTALAQVPPPPPTPVYTVAIQNAPAEFTGISSFANATAPVQVVLTIANVVCANPVTIPVTLTATATNAPAFFTVIPEPSVINVTIGQGPHGSPPVSEPGGGAGDSTLRATIGNITANASVAVTLTANAPAPPGAPDGCQGAGTIAAAASEPVTIFANMTAPPPPPEPTPVEEDTPGFGLVAAIGAVGAAAYAARRRRA